MALAVLSIDLEARLAKFEQGLDKAARLAEKNADRQRAAWARVGASVTGVAAALAGAFAGVGLTALVRGQVDALDALNDSADATGASIENLSALEDIGKRVGTQFDTITSILVKFNGVLADAKPGSAQAEALKAIGLSAAELRKLDPAEALRVTAVALAGFADDGDKARLVQQLFGKSVREAAPFLKDLAEQGQLNAKATAEQAAEAEKFNKQLAGFQANASEAGRRLTTELLPALNKVFEAYQRFGVLDGFVFPALGMDKGSELREQAEQINAAAKRTGDSIDRMAEALARDPGNSLLEGRLEKARARLADLGRQAATVSEQLKAYASGVLGDGAGADYSNEGRNAPRPGVKAPTGNTPTPPKAAQISEASQALARYVEQQQRELLAGVELTEQQKALNLLRDLGSTGQIPQVRALVLGLAAQTDELKRQEDIEKGIAAYLQQQAAARQQIDAALDTFSGRTADALKRAQTDRLEQRLAAGEQFSPQELERIVKGIAGIGEASEQTFAKMDEFAQQAARNIQDSLGQSIKSVLKGDFDSIGELWANLLIDMASQAAAARIGKELFGEFLSGGSLGGLLGGIAGFIGFPGFADGGDHIGGWRIVGERGPELEYTGPSRIFDAPTTRQLLRPQQSQAGGRTVKVSFAPVINVDSRSDRAAVMADMQQALAASNRELLALIKDRMR